MTVTHVLKTHSVYFNAVLDGRKPFEIRKADRPFCVDDTLRLREWSLANGYTGRELTATITFTMALEDVPGIPFGMEFVALGLGEIRETQPA